MRPPPGGSADPCPETPPVGDRGRPTQTGARSGQRLEDRNHWDSVADAIPDLLPAASTQYYRACEIALLQHAYGDLRGKRVLKLDLWDEAVNSRILNWIEEQGAEAFGFDLSLTTVRRARANGAGRLHLAQADIRAVPFADASFDLVYTMGTIEHIPEYEQALREVARVLRPGGVAIVGVPRRWDVFLRPLVVLALEAVGKYAYSPEKTFSARELQAVLERAGLIVTEHTGILSLPGVLRMLDLLCLLKGIPVGKVATAVVRPFRWAETRWRWPGRLGYLLVSVCRKPAL